MPRQRREAIDPHNSRCLGGRGTFASDGAYPFFGESIVIVISVSMASRAGWRGNSRVDDHEHLILNAPSKVEGHLSTSFTPFNVVCNHAINTSGYSVVTGPPFHRRCRSSHSVLAPAADPSKPSKYRQRPRVAWISRSRRALCSCASRRFGSSARAFFRCARAAAIAGPGSRFDATCHAACHSACHST